MEMSGSAQSRTATPQGKLDEALSVLADKAPAFSRLSAAERAARHGAGDVP